MGPPLPNVRVDVTTEYEKKGGGLIPYRLDKINNFMTKFTNRLSFAFVIFIKGEPNNVPSGGGRQFNGMNGAED